jgi:hypothetical protein
MPDIATSGVIHPLEPTRGTTHFKLKKGGLRGVDCMWTDDRGVTLDRFPIEDFDKDTITGRWGHSDDFRVAFLQETEPGKWKPLGKWKLFGIRGEAAKTNPETGIEVLPADYIPPRPTGDMGNGMLLLQGLKGIADADANARVAEARLGHEATLASTREANAMVLTIMKSMFETVRPAPAPQTDPALVALLTKIDTRLTRLEEEFEDPEDEPDDPEEVDYKKYARLVKDVRRDGMGALWAYAKDEGAMALVEALPTLKQRLPDIMVALKPMVDAAFAQLMGRAPTPTVPSPPPVQAPVFAPQHVVAPPPANVGIEMPNIS